MHRYTLSKAQAEHISLGSAFFMTVELIGAPPDEGTATHEPQYY
jgi:hypothetical protein